MAAANEGYATGSDSLACISSKAVPFISSCMAVLLCPSIRKTSTNATPQEEDEHSYTTSAGSKPATSANAMLKTVSNSVSFCNLSTKQNRDTILQVALQHHDTHRGPNS